MARNHRFSCTTIIALIHKGLLYLACDGRVLAWTDEEYVSSTTGNLLTSHWPEISEGDNAKIVRVTKRILLTVAGDKELCDRGVKYIKAKVKKSTDVDVAVKAANDFVDQIKWVSYPAHEVISVEFLICGFVGGNPKVTKITAVKEKGRVKGGKVNPETIKNDGQMIMCGIGGEHAKILAARFLKKTPMDSINAPDQFLSLLVVGSSLYDCSVGGLVQTCVLKPEEDVKQIAAGHVYDIFWECQGNFEEELKRGFFIKHKLIGKYCSRTEYNMMHFVRKVRGKLDEEMVTIAVINFEDYGGGCITLHFVKCRNESEKTRIIRKFNKELAGDANIEVYSGLPKLVDDELLTNYYRKGMQYIL